MDWSSLFCGDQGCSAFAEKFTHQCHPYTVMDKHNAKMNTGTMPGQFQEQPTHHDSTHTYIKQNCTVLIESQNISAFYHWVVAVRTTSVTTYSRYKVLKLADKYTAPF